jgi:serralysin
MASHLLVRSGMLALALGLMVVVDASAYISYGRWGFTASDGVTAALGNSVSLTWSIVPDGTSMSFVGGSSNLVSVFDGLFPESSGVSLEDKLWFHLVEQCFDRWTQLSGLTFVYEPADDGLSGHAHGQWAGALGVRGDVRLGGGMIPATSGNPLASTGNIPDGDITIDTSDTAYYQAAGGSFPYINLRTTLMHEIGHSLGLSHSSSNNAAFLMENFSQTDFDGPQLDDIRGVQYLYGDANERAGEGGGNGSITAATPLGSIVVGQTKTIGADGAKGTVVASTETDFVSIANAGDVDFFSFTIDAPSLVDVVLTPVGGTYHERGTINTSAQSDLSLELYSSFDDSPLSIAESNVNPIGQAESVNDLELDRAGTYYAKITGSTASVQLYELAVSVQAALLLGDFNNDGTVDAADYSVWRDSLGATDDAAIHHRGDGLPGVTATDYQVWKAHFGESSGMGGVALGVVPEPPAIAISIACLVLTGVGNRQVSRKHFLSWDRSGRNGPFC